jgi:prepilin-type processing-associated H-X9-DG protein
VILGLQRCNFGRVHIPANSSCNVMLGQYKLPTQACAFFDENVYATCSDIQYGDVRYRTTGCGPGSVTPAHTKGINMSFIDGHAAWYSLAPDPTNSAYMYLPNWQNYYRQL